MDSPNYGDKMFDLQLQLEANVAKFAAYKAYHATENLYKQANDAKSKDAFVNKAKIILNAYNRQQVTEYNTAIARARTARQFTLFNEDKDLYPNLKWLPSRSANPREEHAAFYGLVLPKNDPFWNNNQPGNLWNCKCDWEETDEKASSDNPKTISAKGLEGNPAVTGEIFSDKHPYFANAKDNDTQRQINIAFHKNTEKDMRKLLQNKFMGTVIKNNTFPNVFKEGIKFNEKGLSHLIHDFRASNDIFIKNKVLGNIDKYLNNGEYVGFKDNSKNHKALEFHYFKIKLPNNKDAYLSVPQKTNGDFILYAISETNPMTRNNNKK